MLALSSGCLCGLRTVWKMGVGMENIERYEIGHGESVCFEVLGHVTCCQILERLRD